MKNYQQKTVERLTDKHVVKPIPVSDYMAKDLITFQLGTEIMAAIQTLLKHDITGAPVLNDKKELVGLIDDKDCLKVLFDSAYHNQPVKKHTVADYMTSIMKTITLDTNIYEVADLFLHTKYKRLLVVNDRKKLVGQISRQDVLRAIYDINRNAH